jgi:hypothetical protein
MSSCRSGASTSAPALEPTPTMPSARAVRPGTRTVIATVMGSIAAAAKPGPSRRFAATKCQGSRIATRIAKPGASSARPSAIGTRTPCRSTRTPTPGVASAAPRTPKLMPVERVLRDHPSASASAFRKTPTVSIPPPTTAKTMAKHAASSGSAGRSGGEPGSCIATFGSSRSMGAQATRGAYHRRHAPGRC